MIAAAITSQVGKHQLPTHVPLRAVCGLRQNSIVLLEQVRTINRSRLRDYIGRLEPSALQMVDQALAVSLGMEQNNAQEMCMSM